MRTPFRVNTDIYIDEKKPPIKQTLTLFQEGVYYDFEDINDDVSQGRITVIDPKRGRIVLIDRKRRVKSTLKTKDIQEMVASARVQVDAKLAAASKTEIQTGEGGKEQAVVKNDSLEYRSTMQRSVASDTAADTAAQFADFADWSARLNAVFPPKLPPYLRLDLNHLIRERNMLPQEIRRLSHQGSRQSTVIARVQPIWAIGNDDATRIARVGLMLADFREVSAAEYWNGTAGSEAEKSPASAK